MHRLRRAAPLRSLRLLRVLTPTPVLALVLALTVVPLATTTADAATAKYAASCELNLRARPSTSSTIRKVIPAGTTVTVSGKVAGGSYATSCRTWVSGSSWLQVVAINGKSVSSLLGVGTVYAASGLFRAASGAYSEGVDVSSWQGTIDFTKVKAAGKQFVIAKASEGTTWTDGILHTFKHEGYDAVWEHLVQWRAKLGRSAPKRQAADRLLNYVSERRGMIRYPEFRRRGWQIGSGPTEAQCKLTVSRLKGRGRRWDRPNAAAVTALDSLERSGQWHLYWKTPNATAA